MELLHNILDDFALQAISAAILRAGRHASHWARRHASDLWTDTTLATIAIDQWVEPVIVVGLSSVG